MTRRNTLLLVSLCLGGALSLLGLLAGFVPQSEGPEVRRKASALVASPRPEDMPVPIVPRGEGERLWAVRRAVTLPDEEAWALPETLPPERAQRPPPAAPVGGEGESVIIFSLGGARLDTGENALGFAAVAPDDVFAPLLTLDGVSMPALLASQAREYGDALDGRGRPLRWLAADTLLAGYAPLGARGRDRRDGPEREAVDSLLPGERYAEDSRDLGRARRYQQLVENFAARYNLDVELVYAIIHSESNFSPTLVSHKSAMGLMQILPGTAGGEVHRYLYGRSGDVSFEDLRVPETNIRYGTTYLHILLTRYFSGVSDPLSREYCAVAAYNMGPNRFLRLYGKSDEEAVANINAMNAAALYEDLTARLPVRETRFYVAKVQRMKDHYSSLR